MVINRQSLTLTTTLTPTMVVSNHQVVSSISTSVTLILLQYLQLISPFDSYSYIKEGNNSETL